MEPPAVPDSTPPQMEGLLDAVLAVSAGLDLSEVLTRIVRSACTLVGARYGALGVLAPDRNHLVEFITHGLSDEERERIGDLPRGHGVLGLLIRDPRPRRLSDIRTHPDSYGFPPNHPPMTSFLAAPVRIRDEVFGNLYLAVKEGAPEFSEEDQDHVVALAAAAGVAIENARLYERSQVQRRWAQAVADVSQALLEGQAEVTALRVMAEQVCLVSGATACAVAIEHEDQTPVVSVVHRRDSGALEIPEGRTDFGTLAGPHWGSVRDVNEPLLLIPGEQDPAVAEIIDDVVAITGVDTTGPTALVPVLAGARSVGALLVCWESADQDVASGVLGPLHEFAQHAGLALVAASAQEDRAVVTLLEDRERIARDMHDHVIQRLFATGLALQASGRLTQQPVLRRRLEEAVDELDLAIKDIRQAIYQLAPLQAPTGLRGRLEELVRNASELLGFPARLQLFGEAASITADQEQDVAAVVREGLANIARHARASSATVRVSMGRLIEVVIVDDGVGTPPTGRRSGLTNLADRASARGGYCEIAAAYPRGTRLTWSVPAVGSAPPVGRAARQSGPWSQD
ncbi:GAF domain-containing protein [Pedococcus sp. KACC 23699]|uniref:GAF domain-containing protein n=1 Tax=Pedococcus sp. KACC 23699 TaxID=3149228 RepID=A0AAU7JSR8_9MICO